MPPKPGPKPDTLKIEGLSWQDAIRKALAKPRPQSGWPKPTKAAPNQASKKK